MTNPDRGQVALSCGGVAYRMQLSWHAISVLKKQTGMGLSAVASALQDSGDDPDPDLIIALIWAALQDHHPDITLDQAGRLMPDGGLEEIMEKIRELFAVAFPKAMARKAAPSENPPPAPEVTQT